MCESEMSRGAEINFFKSFNAADFLTSQRRQGRIVRVFSANAGILFGMLKDSSAWKAQGLN